MFPAGHRPLRTPTRVVATLFALATALGSAPALGWCRTTTSGEQPDPLVCPSEGAPVAWPYGCAALHLDPRLPAGSLSLDALRRATAAAVESWASVSCDAAGRTRPGFRLHLLGDLEVPLGYFEGAPNANTVVVSARWRPDEFHDPDAAALTIVTFGGASATVIDTDVELNALSASNPRGMPFAGGEGLDLESVVVHELGHVQGLAHTARRDAVMWSVVSRGQQRRTPTADDAQGLCAVYPPRDVSACDTTLLGLTLRGQGVGCAVRPGTTSRAPWALGLAVLAALRARRRAARRRPP